VPELLALVLPVHAREHDRADEHEHDEWNEDPNEDVMSHETCEEVKEGIHNG
jgi:hypothetical protein